MGRGRASQPGTNAQDAVVVQLALLVVVLRDLDEVVEFAVVDDAVVEGIGQVVGVEHLREGDLSPLLFAARRTCSAQKCAHLGVAAVSLSITYSTCSWASV